jgi:hypothetical protein
MHRHEAAVILGRLGGRVSSPAKRRAARRNAQAPGSGRPTKFAVGDRVVGGAAAPAALRGQAGTVLAYRHGCYRVQFSNGRVSDVVRSWWMYHDEGSRR